MPKFSSASLHKIATLDPRLQRILRAAIVGGPDFTIISAKRTPAEQAALVAEGKSQTLKSLHLAEPSLAVDLAPWPLDWNDTARFHLLAGWVLAHAAVLGIGVRWGGDWDHDWLLTDQRFHDLGHFELL